MRSCVTSIGSGTGKLPRCVPVISSGWVTIYSGPRERCQVIILWAGGLSGITFFALMKTNRLRVNEEVEDAGLDKAHHSPSKAYSFEAGKAPNSQTV